MPQIARSTGPSIAEIFVRGKQRKRQAVAFPGGLHACFLPRGDSLEHDTTAFFQLGQDLNRAGAKRAHWVITRSLAWVVFSLISFAVFVLTLGRGFAAISEPGTERNRDGEFLGQQDYACLQQAAALGLTLVTYDRRTIPPLLKAWAEEERKHGGVIFADEKTISPSDTGGRALSNLSRKTGEWDWTNRVCFSRR